MQCCVCKQNEATVHLTEVVDDKVQKLDLCEKCASEKGVDDPTSFSLAKMFAENLGKFTDSEEDEGEEDILEEEEASDASDATKKNIIFSGKISGLKSVQSKSDTQTCPQCGYKLGQFRKTGRMGCPVCYKTFSELLEPALKNMHKGSRHIGKAPEGIRERIDISQKLEQKQEKLREAIALENFEQAATLRDEIKSLKVQLESSAKD